MRSRSFISAALGLSLAVVVPIQVIESWRRFEFLLVRRDLVRQTPPVGHTAMDLAIGGGAPYHSTLERLTPSDAKIIFSSTVSERTVQTYFLLGHALFPRQLVAMPGTPAHAAAILNSMTFDGPSTFVLDVGNEIKDLGRRPAKIVEANPSFTLYRLEEQVAPK